ncbi:hypothetical protein CRG98_034940 [Punica granatum]|uniref:Uncharacterized protein n=1 Tax=Punica granatum TaxID=22663 RepID=A0A2I0IKQ1_PUNGR|nr:hypothetical protein CRG98_034940 [Punica granatum]
MKMLHITIMCMDSSSGRRPQMSSMLSMLEGRMEIPLSLVNQSRRIQEPISRKSKEEGSGSPVPSMDTGILHGGRGRGRRLVAPARESIENSNSESLVDLGIGTANRRPNPSTEVAGTYGGCRLSRWRGRGRQLEILALKSNGISDSKSSVDSGVRVTNRQPKPLHRGRR